MVNFAIIEAPSILGLFPSGVERLPEALRAAGFYDELAAEFIARIEPPPFNPERDAATLMLNPAAIRDYSVRLADAVGHTIEQQKFPVVVGGDCSILIGCLLGLRRKGRFGLFHIDGHPDFYQPEAEPEGEAASMEVAIVTGRGAEIVTDIENLRPLVRDEDAVTFGFRDHEEQRTNGSQDVRDSGIGIFDLERVRGLGAATAARQALALLERQPLEGFWVHLDADVLEDRIMPANDYRLPGGLEWEELTELLQTVMGSGKAVGITITIFNPTLDPGGELARQFTAAVVEGLTGGENHSFSVKRSRV